MIRRDRHDAALTRPRRNLGTVPEDPIRRLERETELAQHAQNRGESDRAQADGDAQARECLELFH